MSLNILLLIYATYLCALRCEYKIKTSINSEKTLLVHYTLMYQISNQELILCVKINNGIHLIRK